MRIGVNLVTGEGFGLDLRFITNVIITGRSGSGKSSLLYLLIANCVLNPAVRVVGVDRVGTLFGGLPDDELRVVGDNPAAVMSCLEGIKSLMDARSRELAGGGCDAIREFTPDNPLIVVVVDEFAGVLHRLGIDDVAANRPAVKRYEAHARVILSLLMSEGRKAGITTVLASQIPNKTVFSDGIRENAGCIVSFSNEVGAIKITLPDIPPEFLTRLTSAESGVCVLSAGGVMSLLKIDFLDYSIYSKLVGKSTPRGGGVKPPAGVGGEYYPPTLGAGSRPCYP